MSEPHRTGVRHLLGLDRSGPPPAETLPAQPLRPWTLPNAVGATRLALVAAYLALALSSRDGRSTGAAAAFAAAAGMDYLDGLVARLTGQYSRLGALLDPLTDRVLIVSGAAVAWRFSLLPRPVLAILAARELAMLVLTQAALRRGLEVRINWPGRLAVWPLMLALFLAMIWDGGVVPWLLYVGLALSLLASGLYVRDAVRELRARRPSS